VTTAVKGPHKRYPEQYYKRLWINKDLYAGLQVIAKAESVSIKKIAEWMVEYGIARYDFKEWQQQVRREEAAARSGAYVERSPYLREMDKLARTNGLGWIKKIQRKYQRTHTGIQKESR
jgi:hypothetical protein